jgi:hypothetical protein
MTSRSMHSMTNDGPLEWTYNMNDGKVVLRDVMAVSTSQEHKTVKGFFKALSNLHKYEDIFAMDPECFQNLLSAFKVGSTKEIFNSS